MADISSPYSITIGELSRIVKEFEEKFKWDIRCDILRSYHVPDKDRQR